MASDRDEAQKHVSPPTREVPPSLDERSWILQGLNKLDRRVEDHEKDMKKLIEHTARLEEKIKDLPEIKSDVKKMTRNYWIAFGIFLAIVFISKIFLPDFDITITAKP